MSAELLSGLAGIALSLGFEYIPGLEAWFSKLSKQGKAGIMALTILLVAGLVYIVGCYGPYQTVQCDQTGVWQLAEYALLALIANQSVYPIAKQWKK